MGSCNDKLKARNTSKRPNYQSKVSDKGFINVYDLSGAFSGNIESLFSYNLLLLYEKPSSNFKAISSDPKVLSLRFKLKGNEFYKKQDYQSALESYNKAIVFFFLYLNLFEGFL